MYKIYSLIYFLLLSSFSTQIACEETTPDNTITIFVHGTFPARKILHQTSFKPLIYAPDGLSLAKNLPENYFFHTIAQECAKLNTQRYSLDQFYIFGWESEHVYNTVRMQAAQNLVCELQDLVNNYYIKHNIIPKIQLIGFSHGGNVVLNTANYLPLILNNKKINVNVWLFGTPVQLVNQELINNKNFNKVYSIYSKKDWLQKMDPQGLMYLKHQKNTFWSDRTFNKKDSCIQVDFTVNNQSIAHSYYRYIFKHIPIIQNLIEKESQDIDSGMIAINLEI